MPRLSALLPLLLLLVPGLRAQEFRNYESPPIGALRVSADGSRLYGADTTGGHLVVYSLAVPDSPVLLAEIPVGLDPVSVHPRTLDEVWVTNLLSDDISVVSVSAGRVVATLRTDDEPSDIVFAAGKAFVSTAASDAIAVFDASSRAPLGSVAIAGKDPRALAVSPDGTMVYAVVMRSGNNTTLIPEQDAPPPPAPTNPGLIAAPQQSLIVAADDPTWTAEIPFTLPDNDVAEIDAATMSVTRYFRGVGTTNAGIAVHPTSGDLWIANTNAHNLVRFEPNLRGHVIDSRVTKITTGITPVVTPFDLNPGLDYNLLPNPGARSTALSEPYGVAVDAAAGLVYVAAQGTDRIGVLDLSGQIVDRIEIGVTPGDIVNSREKRGPRALALHPTASVLYVLNRMTDSLVVVDTVGRTVLLETPLTTHDPATPEVRIGRRFLYDAKLSGNGTMSCASCHIDGDIDGLSWDLGDPGGTLAPPPAQPFPFNLGLTNFHPMKGPMNTQTLKGLGGTEPLHWRGDREDFQAFNPAFDKLMGGSPLSGADMDLYADFGTTIEFPPNPNQQLDRSFLTQPADNSQQAGSDAFQASVANIPFLGDVSCATCHDLPTGTGQQVITSIILGEAQQAKVPQLRNLYRKTGFVRTTGDQKSGFGFLKDGSVDTLTSFINLPQFNTWPNGTKDDIVTFLMAFDTGTAPTVGYQATMTLENAMQAGLVADLGLLEAQAAAGDIDVIARGMLDGRLAGLLYDPLSGLYDVDRSGEGPYTLVFLQQLAEAGNAELTFTGVPPGSGVRLGLDRDRDNVLDGDEAPVPYGTGTAGCEGVPDLLLNSEPDLGNDKHAFVARGGPADGTGVLILGLAESAQALAGVTVLVDLAVGPPAAVLLTADSEGVVAAPLPIPDLPALAGLTLYAQVGWLDGCGPQGFSASRGLALTIQ